MTRRCAAAILIHNQWLYVGLEPMFDTPDEFARYLKEDRVRAGRIAKAAGLMPQ